MASTIEGNEKRNADFRALCAVTELGDLDIPAWLRREVLAPNNIVGGATEITDAQIDAVFATATDKFPRADIIAILMEATQSQEPNLPEAATANPGIAHLVARMTGRANRVTQSAPTGETLH